MAENSGLKVFISWSGDLAKEVAVRLRDLLPVIFDGVTPWMSDQDIEAGSRGLDEIARELDDTSFGIIVVTKENQNSQWLNFEAGALSKRVGGESRARVVPLLVDLESGAELTGPMTQFQWKLLGRAGVRELLLALAGAIDVRAEVVERRLAAEWADFDAAVSAARSMRRHPSKKPRRTVESMMEETLELVRIIASERPSGILASGPNLAFLEKAALKSLTPWGKNLMVLVSTVSGQINVDIQDPDGVLDILDSRVHAVIESAFRELKVDTRFLSIYVNGNRAIPF